MKGWQKKYKFEVEIMRRKDREITNKVEIIKVLNDCDTLRIAMTGEEYPYVVPVSFGTEVVDDRLIIYFHCAKEGMKLGLIQSNPNVCFEGDIFLGYEQTAHGITSRYRSVIGIGKCLIVEDTDEILRGLCCITEHCGFSDYPVEQCAGLQRLNVYRIDVVSITGKNNLPG